jgi:hypothetical protein
MTIGMHGRRAFHARSAARIQRGCSSRRHGAYEYDDAAQSYYYSPSGAIRAMRVLQSLPSCRMYRASGSRLVDAAQGCRGGAS